MIKKNLGFTMIELLIVIAVLGVLAVAVLSAINPIEQINRGKDLGNKSDSEQLINAIDRYYATKGYYPWMAAETSENVACAFTEIDDVFTTCGADEDQDVLDKLSSGGSAEIKSSFVERITNGVNYNNLTIYNRGISGDSTFVCFKPASYSMRVEAWNRCANSTTPVDYPALACPVAGSCVDDGNNESNAGANATGCYLCLP